MEDLIRRRAEPLKRIISALELTQTVNEGRAQALKAPRGSALGPEEPGCLGTARV